MSLQVAQHRRIFELLGRNRRRDEFLVDHGPDTAGMYPAVSEAVVAGFRSVRRTMHLRWNRIAVVVGQHEAEGRWELWDRDAGGERYVVMQFYDPSGEHELGKAYRPPDMQDVEMLRHQAWLLANHDGDMVKVEDEILGAQERARARMDDEDSTDFLHCRIGDLLDHYTPKSYAGQRARGQRPLSA